MLRCPADQEAQTKSDVLMVQQSQNVNTFQGNQPTNSLLSRLCLPSKIGENILSLKKMTSALTCSCHLPLHLLYTCAESFVCISIIQFTSDCVSYQETNHYKHDWLKRCEKSLLVLPLSCSLSLPRATWSHRASADSQMNTFVYFKAYSSVVKNSPEASSSSPVFSPKFASHTLWSH